MGERQMTPEQARAVTESIKLEIAFAGIPEDAVSTMFELVAADLPTLERVVDDGLASFMRVGFALMAIRDRELYLGTHETFDAYCRERWGIDRTYAGRIMEGAEIAAAVPIGTRPQNEAQARELRPLADDPDAVREVMAKVHEATDGKPTAAAIRAAVAVRAGGSNQDEEGADPTPSAVESTDPPAPPSHEDAAAELERRDEERNPDLALVEKFMKAAAKCSPLYAYDPGLVAEAADPESRRQMEGVARDLHGFATRIESALRRTAHLRSVGQ